MTTYNDNSEQDLAEGVVAREVVKEILNYGVTQLQIRKIIKLLSLELDNHILMKEICSAIEGTDSKKTVLSLQ